ncbi:MAG: hypothetical protein PHC31_09655 [Clostridia bacterium]|nr:hypothetical protein [Clostridia bacterium]
MNYQTLDYLDKAISQDFESDNTLLIEEGVLSTDGDIVLNKINLMTGVYACNLADRILEADMNLQETITYLEQLRKQDQYMGIYYFLFHLFAALQMDIPYLFMQVPSHTQVLQYYINELIADLKDCSMDQSD